MHASPLLQQVNALQADHGKRPFLVQQHVEPSPHVVVERLHVVLPTMPTAASCSAAAAATALALAPVRTLRKFCGVTLDPL